MIKKPVPDWFELSLKRLLFGYRDHFGKMPPPNIIKFARTGLDAVNELLNEHVMRDEEVTDWDAFYDELIRRKEWSKGSPRQTGQPVQTKLITPEQASRAG